MAQLVLVIARRCDRAPFRTTKPSISLIDFEFAAHVTTPKRAIDQMIQISTQTKSLPVKIASWQGLH